MKYLRSLMQQSVTACKNQAKLIQQFTLSLLYLLIIHIVALLFFFLFRLVLFTSIDYQFPPDIQNNFLMQATAFIKGLWFDNVIACYILLLPLVILWIYNPQIQISAESETKRSIFRKRDKTKRSKKESAQHSKSRNKSFVMTSVSAL